MKTYYAITSGIYSNYHVIAITDDRKKAEHFRKVYNETNRESADIEEFEEMVVRNRIRFVVVVHTNGRVDYVRVDEYDEYKEHENSVCELPYDKRNPNQTFYEVFLSAKDKEHALKSAYDMIAVYKAQKEGIA